MKFSFPFAVILAFGFSITTYAQDQTLASMSDCDSFVDSTMHMFYVGDFEKLGSAMAPYWPVEETVQNEVMAKGHDAFEFFKATYGGPFEIVKGKTSVIEGLGIRYTMYLKFETHALRVYYYFYEGVNGYFLNSYGFDVNWKEDF
ncbi:hypothetical protein [Phaeocystidibacter luteus]|uniref:DUF3887 domain-containing protein n=1 Tax=Phaeocystidibacter luteus TaxID=911197 RepID=A0A6N6RGV7_9FLAO|nr:hypothetical protein [Phaeocystidibacter luteus]KAB2810335.1 hypothetical protein F8C67_07040 [Phaeocystidibacter luteus]